MFVEFLGLPASGKSTISQKLMDMSESHGLRTSFATQVGTLPIDKKTVPQYVKNSQSSATLFRATQFRLANQKLMDYVQNCNNIRPVPYAQYTALSSDYQAYLERQKQFDFTLVDEGFLHRGVAFHLPNRFELPSGFSLNLEYYVSLIPRIDVVALLDLSPDVAFQRAVVRLKNRAEKRGKTPGNVYQRIVNFHGGIEVFKLRQKMMEDAVVLMKKRGTHVIRVNADQTPSECAQLILTGLSADVSTQRHSGN